MKSGIRLPRRKPIPLRPLTAEPQQAVQAGRRSPQSFTGRRCQVLLASQGGQPARQIADPRCCGDPTVRNIWHAFHCRGIAILQPPSQAPRHRPQAVFEATRREQLRPLLHQSPRAFGYPTRRWTLALAAQVASAEGMTPRQGSGEAIRPALQRLRVGWKRAQHWIPSPDPAYVRKKNRATG